MIESNVKKNSQTNLVLFAESSELQDVYLFGEPWGQEAHGERKDDDDDEEEAADDSSR